VSTPLARALAAPALQASVPDLEFANTLLLAGCEPLDDAPILDLRIRKGVRRNGVKLAILSARPSALDRNATRIVRHAPGDELAALTALEAAVRDGSDGELGALATLLKNGGEDVVILWGERIGERAAAVLLRIAGQLGIAEHDGAGLLQIPAGSNGRGLREAGAVPDAGPGYEALSGEPGRGADEIARAAAAGELTAIYLLQTDPIRDLTDSALWERALRAAPLVVAHANVLTEGLREHATVIFPAESHAEKDGTVVHPDGRLQRLRIAIERPGEVAPGWAVIAELARRAGTDLGVERSEDAFEQLAATVSFYAGLTVDEIGGQGLRWPERVESWESPRAEGEQLATRPEPTAESPDGALRLGTYRPIWAAPECEISPSLQYLIPSQQLVLSPHDAERLGLADGDDVTVSQNGTRLHARATVRSTVVPGSAFLATGIRADSANALTEPLIEVVRR
jgi:NADH-quinone oxidoreductase subunit G